MAPTVGHEVILYEPIHILSKMVSTRSKARVNKQAEAGPVAPTTTTPDLAAILDGQAKCNKN